MIKQFFYGIISGIIVTLFVGQYDPWVKQHVGEALKALYGRALHCTVVGTVCEVDFFNPRILFSDFSVSPACTEAGHWSWKTKRYESGFSWWSLLIHKTIDLWITVTDLDATSDFYNGMPSILPHIKSLMSVPDFPIKIFLKSVRVKNATLSVDSGTATHASISWDCEIQKTPERIHTCFHTKDSTISHKNCSLAHMHHGTIVLDTDRHEKKADMHASIDGQIDLPQLGTNSTCFITGTWQQDFGKLSVCSIDKSLRIDPLFIAKHGDDIRYRLSAQLPLSYVLKTVTGKDLPSLHGSCSINGQGVWGESGHNEWQITCHDLHLPFIKDTVTVTCSLHQHCSGVRGTLDIQNEKSLSWHGLFLWKNKEQSATCRFYNNSTFSIPYLPWHIKPKNINCAVNYHKTDESLTVGCLATAHNTITNSATSCSGILKSTVDGKFQGDGLLGTNRYTCTLSRSFPYLINAACSDRTHKPLCVLRYDHKKNVYHSTIEMPCIQGMCLHFLHQPLHGEGALHATSHVINNTIHTSLHLANAAILIPQSYNLINGLDTAITFDLPTKHITFQDFHCTLNNGSVRSPRATVWLDQSGALNFAHIPLIIDHCPFFIKREFFAIVSGHLLLSKQPHDELHATGHVLLDRSQLTEISFSEQEQKKLFQTTNNLFNEQRLPLITGDISLETKDPIRIDTPFLQANAAITMQLHGHSTKPCASGTLTVLSGMIKFPYMPLHIRRGTISFLEDQPLDPLIELIAKNRIKNHTVTLQIAGSVQNQIPLLESTPPLTEEQIINLLLTGTHEESLNAVIPTLLVKNIPDLIFSSHKSDFYTNYLKPLMKQINVQLKPNFNNQTGEENLRGALELTLSDRWRALVEKNFNMAEDTHLELECTLSDDVTFRMLRDGRYDVGGEIEMKWKF